MAENVVGDADLLDPNAHGDVRPDPPAAPAPPPSSPVAAPATMPDMGGGSQSPVQAISELADIKRREIAATGKVDDALIAGMDRDAARVQEASRHTGIEPGSMRPWNEEYESAKHQTDPIQAFGSIGSVFGILASAFTHAPMENALNASASAINAIKAGNEKEYERSYKAWQDNTKLALDRHKIAHEQYTDAVEILKTNMAVGEAKLRVLASKYGDQKVLTMLDNGMDKEVIDMMAAREKLAGAMQENFFKTTTENAKMSQLFSLGYDPKNPTSDKSQAALKQFNRVFGETKSIDTQFSQQWWEEHPSGTSEQFSKAFGDFKRSQYNRPPNAEQEFIQRWWAEHPGADVEEFSKAFQEFKRGQHPPSGQGSTALTPTRQVAAGVDEVMKQYKIDHPEASPEELLKVRTQKLREAQTASAPITGNRADEIKGKVNRIVYMEDTITKVEELLKKHNAITGLGGKVTRPAEIVGNIFGSNETDRKQFERYISELKEWAPRALTDSNGRPLSSEAGNVSNIIAGLQVGDTTANTARAYLELRKLLSKMKGDLQSRGAGGGEAPPATAAPEGDWWKNSPVVH